MGHKCPTEYYHHCSALIPQCDTHEDSCSVCSGDAMCTWTRSVTSDTPSGYLWDCFPTADTWHVTSGELIYECDNVPVPAPTPDPVPAPVPGPDDQQTCDPNVWDGQTCFPFSGDLQACIQQDCCLWSDYDKACVQTMGHKCPTEYYHHCSALIPQCDTHEDSCSVCSGDAMCTWTRSVTSDTPSGYLWDCFPTADTWHVTSGEMIYECDNATVPVLFV